MKHRMLLEVVVTLAIGIGAASAQNQPTTNVAPPPNSINKGSTPSTPSGSEAQSAAQNRSVRITGGAKFCAATAGGKLLRCRYATMAACEKSKAHGNLHCVARPS